MFRKQVFFRYILPAAALAALAVLAPQARAWENQGHRMVNRLAITNLPADAPAFLSTPTAIDEIEYLGPEPDRWRSPAEPELNAAQAPEHFIDLEPADALGALLPRRLDFEAKIFAANQRPEKIGLLPWEAVEVWERLKAAMREYRALQAEKKDTKLVEQAILFYTGWLGHYASDGSQPHHTTIQFNGWTGDNPNGYTTSHQIHHVFEGVFVVDNIKPVDIQAHMTGTNVIKGDMFPAFVAYLRVTHGNVEKLYQLEKGGGFEGVGTPTTRAFVAERLAAGASMLRDMIYTAWLDSAQPVVDPYAQPKPAAPAKK